MNETEAQNLLDYLAGLDVKDLELEQTGGDVYAVIRKVEGGVESYIPYNDVIAILFYQGTAWADSGEPTSYDEVDSTEDLV